MGKKTIRFIGIIILILIVLSIYDFIMLYKDYNSNIIENTNILINDKYIQFNLLDSKNYFLLCLIIIISRFIPLMPYIVIYIVYRIAKRKIKREKLNKDDFNKNIDYYRNIIKEYPICELSYIDDFEIMYPKDVVLELLDLEKRNIIKLNNDTNKIEILNNKVLESELDNYILDNIYDGKVGTLNVFQIKQKIENDCYKKSLIYKDNYNNYSKYFIFTIIIIFISSFFSISSIIDNSIFFKVLLFIIILLTELLLPVCFPYFIIKYSLKQKNPYKRTDKGIDINNKLEGLKKFLKDFSNLEDKEKDYIEIWDDYLLYSVLFNQNKIVIDEVYNKYFIK